MAVWARPTSFFALCCARNVEGSLSLPHLVKPKGVFVFENEVGRGLAQLENFWAYADMPVAASSALQCPQYILPSASWNLSVRRK